MPKRTTPAAFWLLLWLLSACTLPAPVLLTATPDTGELPTATIEPIASATTAVTATRSLPTNTPLVPVTPTQEVKRTCARPSYNVNGQGLQDEQYLIDHLARLNPCVVLVMDNGTLAWRLAQMFPDMIVIVRSYSAFEGGQCLLDDPIEQVNRFVTEMNRLSPQAKHRLVMHGCSNEPSFGGNNTLQQILDAEVRLMRHAASLGIRVCAGNFGVGTFAPEHVEAKLYNPFIQVINEGRHFFCLHEYTSLTLANGVGRFSRNDMLDPARMQPQFWPTRDQLPMSRIPLPTLAQSVENMADLPFGYEMMLPYYSLPSAQAASGVLPPYWHILRHYWPLIVAQESGIAIPPVIITECCHDNLSDINRENPPALDMLASRWGFIRFNRNLRGAPSHCHLWENFYYPQWACHEALLQQWLWLDAVYGEHVVGWTAFTWSWNDHWISFDMSTRQWSMNVREFHRLLEECYGQLPHCEFQWAA